MASKTSRTARGVGAAPLHPRAFRAPSSASRLHASEPAPPRGAVRLEAGRAGLKATKCAVRIHPLIQAILQPYRREHMGHRKRLGQFEKGPASFQPLVYSHRVAEVSALRPGDSESTSDSGSATLRSAVSRRVLSFKEPPLTKSSGPSYRGGARRCLETGREGVTNTPVRDYDGKCTESWRHLSKGLRSGEAVY